MINTKDIDWSYYSLPEVKKRIIEGEPVFCIRGTDPFAVESIRYYANLVLQFPGCDRPLFNKGIASDMFADKVAMWQSEDAGRLKLPDLPAWTVLPDMPMQVEPRIEIDY